MLVWLTIIIFSWTVAILLPGEHGHAADLAMMPYAVLWITWPIVVVTLLTWTYEKNNDSTVYNTNQVGANFLLGVYSGNALALVWTNIQTTISWIDIGSVGETGLVYIFSPWYSVKAGFFLAVVFSAIGYVARKQYWR